MLKERQSELWSKRISGLREKLVMSQEELARELGVTRVSVSTWESGKHVPLPVHRRRILKLEQGLA